MSTSDSDELQLCAELEGHEGEIRALVPSYDGVGLLSGAMDRLVRVWAPVDMVRHVRGTTAGLHTPTRGCAPQTTYVETAVVFEHGAWRV